MFGPPARSRPARLLVVHRSLHHAAGSGHAGGARFLHPDHVVEGHGRTAPYWLAFGATRLPRADEYGSLGFQREVEAWAAARHQGQPLSVHYVSGEHDANHLPRIGARRGWKTSAWFHAPPDRLDRVLSGRKGLAHLDQAWAVASNQLPVLEAHFGADRVGLAWHGVDVERFTPPSEPGQRRRRVVFLGSHLRDFAQLARVYRRLEHIDPTIERRVVVPWHTVSALAGVAGERRVDVSDAELVAELQVAGVVYLPLLGSTANNSLLEALACGAPVVATDVGGVAEYAGGAARLVSVSDDDDAVEAVRAVLDDPDLAAQAGRDGRARAEELSWSRVGGSFRWAAEDETVDHDADLGR